MACFEYGTIVDLGVRETLSLPNMRGATLRVTRGTVWITQQDDTRDIVLRAGDSWAVERNGLTIVEAQEDTSFCVMGRKIEARATAFRRGWWGRVRDAAAYLLALPSRNPYPHV